MSRRRSKSRSRVKSNATSSSVVYNRDYDQHSEEFEVYNALTRAVDEHNQDATDDIQLGPLNALEIDLDWFEVPFATSGVFSFNQLADEMGDRLDSKVDISAGVDVTEGGSTHYNFKIFRESYKSSHRKLALWEKLWRTVRAYPLYILAIVLIWYFFM